MVMLTTDEGRTLFTVYYNSVNSDGKIIIEQADYKCYSDAFERFCYEEFLENMEEIFLSNDGMRLLSLPTFEQFLEKGYKDKELMRGILYPHQFETWLAYNE